MSTASGARALGRLPGLPRAPLLWGAAAVLAGLAAALGLAPFLLLALPFLLGAALGLLGSPIVFLCILVGISGIGFSWIEGLSFQVGGNTIRVSGLHWGLIAVFSAAVFLREGLWPGGERTGVRALPPPKLLRPYAWFVLLATLGILWTPDTFEGIKNAVQYGAPLLVALMALAVVRNEADLEAVRKAFWVGLVLAVAAAFALNLSDVLTTGTPGLSGAMGNRTFAIYLLPLLGLALAGWRYRSGGYALGVGLVLVLLLLTLSRMALLAAVALLWLSTRGRPIRGRLAGVALAGLTLMLALLYAPFRARVLSGLGGGLGGLTLRITGEGGDAALSLGGVDLTGRGLLWLQTALHAMREPLVGHGTGSATHYLSEVLRLDIHHPHNDYLRLFHDLGALGLVAGLLFVGITFFALRRTYDRAEGRAAMELALAALLAWAAYALMALTDNTMVYVPFFTQNVFLLIALALRARELERRTAGERPA